MSESKFKDTHRENTPSSKTEALMKSMNMYIWTIGILNQLFIRDFYTQIKFPKNEVVSEVHSFCTPHSICFNIGFWQGSLV